MAQLEGFNDLILGTYKDQPDFKWSMLAFPLTHYVGFQQLLAKKRVAVSSGYAFQWFLQTSTNGTARHVPLNATDNVTIYDSMATASGVLRNTTNAWSLDERMIDANMGKRQIFDIVKTARAAGWGDFVKLVESSIWGTPNASQTNDPLMLFYYLVTDAASGAGAFTAQLPVLPGTSTSAGFTTIAGIVPADVARWRNWAFIYTNITKTDLALKMGTASFNTDFESPVNIPDAGSAADYGIYAPYSVVQLMEQMLEAQNQNLGKDFASMNGMTLFQRHPVTAVPALGSRAGAPILGVNWGQMKFRYLEGWYFREKHREAALQHNSVNSFVDLTWGLQCLDRSTCWIGSTS
jgi:hypothetical protein